VKNNLSQPFEMFCLTDSKWDTDYPVKFIDVKKYDLDIWWNKVAMFDKTISGVGVNLYFDLDVDIVGNIDFLLDDLEKNKLCVIDTLWKGNNYVEESINSRKNGKAFYHYGNTSVMGWFADDHQYLLDNLINNPFITIEHYGDDSYVNTTAKTKYFKPLICTKCCPKYSKIMIDSKIWIHFRDPPP